MTARQCLRLANFVLVEIAINSAGTVNIEIIMRLRY
jgi:hypothetical protein